MQTPDAMLPGLLSVPRKATGMVAFVHGGGNQISARNRAVAGLLNEAGLGTLLFDLLTAPEAQADAHHRRLRFDINLLRRRLAGVMDWLKLVKSIGDLPLGVFGASTGSVAAFGVAAEYPQRVSAIVSRGGRPDLAGDALKRVRAPTLMIVGGADVAIVELHREAAARITCPHRLELIPDATHLFEEPGAMERVALLTRDWFVRHLSAPIKLS